MPVITNPYRYAGPTFGNASRVFDGVNDYVSWDWVPDVKSISVWVKFNSLQNGPVVYAGSDTFQSGQWDWSLYVTSGAIYARGNPGAYGHAIISAPTTEVWYHIVIVRSNDTGNYEGWADGIKGLESADYAGTSETAGHNLRVGRADPAYVDVSISDLRLYDINLSSSDISNLYNGVSVKEENLIGWFFTDNDNVLDYSGNGNHGTNNGSTYSTDGPFDVTPVIVDPVNLVLDLDAGNSASYSGTGTTWSDLSNYSNSGTLVNGVGYSSDGGGSLVFDGVNDYFNISSAIEEPANTISIWVNMQSTNYSPIVYYGDDAFSSGSWTWGIAVFPVGTHGFNERPASYPTTGLYTENIDLNVWKNFVLVRDDNGDAKVYKNGSLVGTKLNGGTTSLRSPSDRLFIGKAGGFYGNFLLSKVSIYNKALSELEIQQNFELYRGRYGI